MARIKRYDLYEGDGEVIGEEDAWAQRSSRPEESAPYRETSRIRRSARPEEFASRPDGESAGREETDGSRGNALPGKAPLGRDETLREKDEARSRYRYFTQNSKEDDGLGAASSLFDDFDRFNDPSLLEEHRPVRKKKKLKHKGAWVSLIVLSLAGILGAAYLTLPQLTGVRYRFLPNIAFANGTVIALDQNKYSSFEDTRKEIYHDLIYPGIYIDGVHVGGMTKAQASETLKDPAEVSSTDFDITVTVGNQSWHVTPDRVPVTRNIREVVDAAWAVGRGNTAGLRGSGRTPFQERVDKASSIRSYPVSMTTETTWDHDALRTLCEGIVNYVNRDPVNSNVASFDFGTLSFTFTEDRPGAYLDVNEVYDRIALLLDTGDYHASLFLTPEKRIADVTKTELMNSFGQISTYTTKTTNNKNRNKNIQLSAQAINGITVLPGEIFSFNATTGERTQGKGYMPATAISGGQNIEEIGGGVCQTSSTLFNAVARANLEIVERSPHAWPSSYVEKGFDATVNWPGLDFKFKNNTDWPVFIIAGYSNQKVTVSVYGISLGADTRIELESITTKTLPQPEGTNYVLNTSLPAGVSKRTVTGRKGYVVETWKVWYQGEREIKREKLFTSTYKAYQETIEYNPT